MNGTAPPDALTRQQVHALIDAAAGGRITADHITDRSRWLNARNSAAVALLAATGARHEESIIKTDLSDMVRVPGGLRLHIRFPKGINREQHPARPRFVAISGTSKPAAAIEAWLEQRGEEPGPLFPTLTGKRLDTAYLRRWIPKWARAAGIPQRVHTHHLRHSFAIAHRKDIVLLSEQLGHASGATTYLYLKRLGCSAAVDAMIADDWL